MLLYTRRAPPKEPKRRSRAGCTYCKEKKKKCDEVRPKCSRCVEHGIECTYEMVKPRQRKKREEPLADSGSDRSYFPPNRRMSELSFAGSECQDVETFDSDGEGDGDETSGKCSIVLRTKRGLDLSVMGPCPPASPLLEFVPPQFAEFTDRPNRRALVDHFCNIMSHLLVFREESGNPFQQLVLPLTQKSPPVMNAIYALSCAHLEYRGVQNAEKALFFHSRAIQGLGKLIEQNNGKNKNEILAAIMLLVYYEVLVQKSQSNIVGGHLKGALTVLCANPDPLDTTSAFLERAFRFYDVITALSNGTAPLSAAPAPGCLLPVPPLGAPAASPLCNVDTLLGMATTLWPIIHRLSDVRSLKTDLELAVRTNAPASKIAVLRTEFDSTTAAIETALTHWQPHLPPNFIPDEEPLSTTIGKEVATGVASVTAGATPTESPLSATERGRMYSILHNALAYRHAAFVYLYRTIYGYPQSHEAVQSHAHLGLTHCAGTVAHSGPMGALLWPLFATACEAVSAEDRDTADRTFALLRKRQGMMNIERAWEIVQEVWRRADLADVVTRIDARERAESVVTSGPGVVEVGEGRRASIPAARAGLRGLNCEATRDPDLWRQVSREMGVNIVFG